MECKIGQNIGSYTLLSVCGAGAYGQVFLAQNTMTQHRVALKILNLSEKIIARELQGLVNYRDCRHPNLLQIHHIEKIDGHLYYTMDAADNAGDQDRYVPDTLAQRLAKHKTLPAAEIIQMAEELLDGLAYLHKHGLLHRDIKPDNIFWVDGRATLGDIGLTAPMKNASLVGTPDFMPEELLLGKRSATAEDDLYALGKVIYCALTGCSPKEYPRYPRNVTIADAAPIIKAYTAVLSIAISIKSSDGMKDLLNSSYKENPSCAKSRHVRKYLKWTACLTGCLILALIFYGSIFYNLNETASCTVRSMPRIEQAEKKEATDTYLASIPQDADIVSDFQLVYSNRNNAAFQKALMAAREAVGKLDAEVEEKLKTLNTQTMNRENYLRAQMLIHQAKNEHLTRDPFCRLLAQENKIQGFMTQHSSGGMKVDSKQLIKMLDDRDEILDELSKSVQNVEHNEGGEIKTKK